MKPKAPVGREGPRLPRHLPRGSAFSLEDDAEIHSVTLAEITFPPHPVKGVIIEQARLSHASFAACRLNKPRSSDARFEKCDFTAAEWTEAHLLRVEFIGCRMLGMQWANLDGRDVRLEDCLCDEAFFLSARLSGTQFERCTLKRASFEGADLRGAQFRECDLSQADLRGAVLMDADLRGCTINGLKVGAQDLLGAVLDPAQATQVAGLLGIVIRDLSES